MIVAAAVALVAATAAGAGIFRSIRVTGRTARHAKGLF